MPEVIRRTGLPRKRAATSRSQNGCMICRVRRIKCDEGKPSCKKCTISGWKCGYVTSTARSTTQPNISSGSSGSTRRLVATSSEFNPPQGHSYRRNTDPLPPPSSLRFQSAEQYQYYQFFEKQTVSELSGVFSKDVWGQLVLRACHKEDFVKHAVVAIAALKLSLQDSSTHSSICGTSRKIAGLQVQDHHALALREYDRALKLMRRTTPVDKDEALRNRLLASLLIICFENIYGNTGNAIAQAHIGATLLNKWINEAAQNGAKLKARISPRPTCVENELLCSFARLDIQLKAPTDTGLLNASLTLRSRDLEALEDMPALFESSEQAKYYVELISRLVFTQKHLIQGRSIRIVPGEELEDSSMLVLQDGRSMEQETASNQSVEEDSQASMLTRFSAAFAPLLHHARSIEGRAEFLPTSMLLVHFTALPFGARSSFSLNSEMWYDSQQSAMETCISILCQVLETMYAELDSTYDGPKRTRYTLETQYVPVLGAIALKCRHSTTRRKAIELLEKYPAKEGFGDSKMVVAIARRCMELEEDGLAVGSYVPEERRLTILRQEILWSERTALFTCARSPVGTNKMETLPTMRIKW